MYRNTTAALHRLLNGWLSGSCVENRHTLNLPVREPSQLRELSMS